MNFDISNINNLFDQLDYSVLSKNIIVSSLYKLESITTNQFNKNYINVLKFCKKIAKTLNLSFILFIDYTIYENRKYINELSKLNNIILIKYDSSKIRKYPAFQQFYGELINFLPLFNYQNNKFDNVFIFNIEYYLYDKHPNLNFDIWNKSFNLFKSDKLDIIYLVYPYTSINTDFNEVNPFYVNNDGFVLSTNNIICKYKFNHKLFDDILNNSFLEKKFKKSIKHKLIKQEIIGQTFLTFILYNYIKKLNYGYIDYFNIYYILNKVHYNLFNPEYDQQKLKIYTNEVLKLYQYILNTSDTNLNQLFKNIFNNDKVINKFYEYNKNKIFDKKTNNYIQQFNGIIKTYIYYNKNKITFFN